MGKYIPDNFLSQSAVVTAGTGVSALLSAVYIGLVGRLLGPGENSEVVAVLALANLFSLVLGPLDTGICKFAAMFHGENAPGKLATLAFKSLRRLSVLVLLGSLFWLPLSPLVRNGLILDSLGPLLWLTVFSGLWVLVCVPRGILRGQHRFLAYSVNQVVESAVRLLCGIAALAVARSASGALAGYTAGIGASLLFGLWQIRQLHPEPRTQIDTRHLFAFSLPLFFVYFYFLFVVNADMLVAKRCLTEHDAGIYAASSQVARVLNVALTPLVLVLFARVAALHAQKRSARRLSWLVGLALATGLFASMVVPWCWGDSILVAVFGPEFAGGGAVLCIMWATMALLILEAAATFALLGIDRTRGSWAFLLPCLLLAVSLWQFHESAIEVALSSLAAVVAGGIVVGSLICLSACHWKGREAGTSTRNVQV